MAIAATHAALLLAQGTGRLLRATDDRGVIAVLDPRLATARYGGFLRASLPPYWSTTDPEVVLGALRRLRAAERQRPAEPRRRGGARGGFGSTADGLRGPLMCENARQGSPQ